MGGGGIIMAVLYLAVAIDRPTSVLPYVAHCQPDLLYSVAKCLNEAIAGSLLRWGHKGECVC